MPVPGSDFGRLCSVSACTRDALLSCQNKKKPTVSVHQKGGRSCRSAGGGEPLLESTRSLHRFVLVGRCPEQLDSGLASNRQHVLAPGTARPPQARMLAANQRSHFPPPFIPPHYPRVNPSGAARPQKHATVRRVRPGGEGRTRV